MAWLEKIKTWANRNRPLALLAAFALSVAAFWLIDLLFGGNVFQRIFYPEVNTTADARLWSSVSYTVILVTGLPVAFLLWHWRDVNVREQIENARKDINLKEFLEVQLRAAGVLDEKLPPEAREQLQIAALHQMRGFLRGDYGQAFRRPAFELLLAGHAAAIHRIGLPEIQMQFSGKSVEDISDAIEVVRARLSPIDRTRMVIIRDEIEHVFAAGFPTSGRRFDLVDFSGKNLPHEADVSFSHFVGSTMIDTNLENTQLRFAHLEGAFLVEANFTGANLDWTHFDGANLNWAILRAANLTRASLENTNLSNANLAGASLSFATFNDDTCMSNNWENLSLSQRTIHHQRLRELGAKHVGDPSLNT